MKPKVYRRPLLRAFKLQRYNAQQRGVEFGFTYEAWIEWWGKDISKRGRGADQLVMLRYGDEGPYSSSNCYKGIPSEREQVHKLRWMRYRESGGECALSVRGDGHPRSRAVITPAGRFGSMALAAEHYGISRTGMLSRVRKGGGFRYEAQPHHP